MGTVQTQIRIEEDLKKQAVELFSQLGIDMSSAVNMFLKQAVMRRGLPFNVELPHEAREETRRTNREPNVKSCREARELFKERLEDGTES